MEPSIGIQGLFGFTEEWRLCTNEILVTSHGRIAVITTSAKLLMLLILLGLDQQVEQLSLPSHNFGKVRRWRWRLLRTASLIRPETFRGSARGSNHLKQRRCPSLTI
jgi:heme A synthase